MGALDGRVAIITGAGRGIGREHALLFAAEGARVVVNDLGASYDGTGATEEPARIVVDEIKAAGGEAIANTDDVADEEGAQNVVSAALEAFGDLHVLVNNAGIMRDALLVDMSWEDWDAVTRGHLRSTFSTTKCAARHWRAQSDAGMTVKASVTNTTSTAGLFGTLGKANYGAGKAGIAAFSMVAQMELGQYGVRVNAIAPAARTRLTNVAPQIYDPQKPLPDRLTRLLRGKEALEEGEFDDLDPANMSPFVAYLSTEDCPIKGRIFQVFSKAIHLYQPWTIIDSIETDHRWSVAELEDEAARLADVPFTQSKPSP